MSGWLQKIVILLFHLCQVVPLPIASELRPARRKCGGGWQCVEVPTDPFFLTVKIAETIKLAVALLCGRTEDRFLTKDDWRGCLALVSDDQRSLNLTMPRVLHDASSQIVVQVCLQQPASIPDVVFFGSLTDCSSSDGELCAARRSHRLWNCDAWKEIFECIFVKRARSRLTRRWVRCGSWRSSFGMWPDLTWTAERPDATKVGVTLLLDVRKLQSRQYSLAIVQRIVIMPLVPIRM